MNLEKAIKDRKLLYAELGMTEIVNDLSTDMCPVHCAYVGLNVKSNLYGKIQGVFTIKNRPSQVFEFSFHIHEPKQTYSHLSNKMDNMYELIEKSWRECTFIERGSMKFGYKAFWVHTPDSLLNDDEKIIRNLIRNVIKHSREKDYCKMLRKTDKQRLKYLKYLDEKRMIKTGTTGIE
jgi:hypothetical protein